MATDQILFCNKLGRVTSASAMVFMDDSERAAELANEYNIDVGLHLNFTQKPAQQTYGSLLNDYQNRIMEFLNKNKYNFLIYNPSLRKQFEYVFRCQYEEFERTYGKSPSHIDGHHHMHLCANMLFDNIIPEGHIVRRNFSFARGEKNWLNRLYRRAIDKWLAREYLITDYFFSLSERLKTGRLAYALELAKVSIVELQTHPEFKEEFEWLKGDTYVHAFSTLQKGTYTHLGTFISLNGKK